MTTKTLRQIAEQDQAELAERHNGTDAKQRPRHVWAVLEMKPALHERQWQAAHRAVDECRAAFDGMRRAFDAEPVDGGSSDYGLAARVAASGRLAGLQFAARGILGRRRDHAPKCVAWVIQLWTLEDMAAAMECWRRMGSRPPILDQRPARRLVDGVLTKMADYYEGASTMNEYEIGIGEGWVRADWIDPADAAMIRVVEGRGVQVSITPNGTVFTRDPSVPSPLKPRPVLKTVAV